MQESIFSTGTHELRLFDLSELPNSTCPGDYKQPLLDEVFSHMLFYAESPSLVDLGRAEKLFRTIGTLLKSGNGLGRHMIHSMLFTTMSSGNKFSNTFSAATIGGASAAASQQLLDFMARHYRHIQGEGFWTTNNKEENETTNGLQKEGCTTTDNSKNQQPKQFTLFEVFVILELYFLRSYYLNSPTNYVSEDDLILAWKCKVFEFFFHLLKNNTIHQADCRSRLLC